MSSADITLAKDVAAFAETKAFKDIITKATNFYDPSRQQETIHDALRVIIVTMNALAPKTITALKEAEYAANEA